MRFWLKVMLILVLGLILLAYWLNHLILLGVVIVATLFSLMQHLVLLVINIVLWITHVWCHVVA